MTRLVAGTWRRFTRLSLDKEAGGEGVGFVPDVGFRYLVESAAHTLLQNGATL